MRSKVKSAIKHEEPKEQLEPIDWLLQLEHSFNLTVRNPIQMAQKIHRAHETPRCNLHNIAYSIYCKICMKPLCASCMYQTMNHRRHHIVPIEKAAGDIKSDVKGLANKINRILEKGDEKVRINSEMIITLEREYNPMRLSIEQFYDKLHKSLEVRKKEQLEYIAQTRKEVKHEIQEYSKQLAKTTAFLSEKLKIFATMESNQLYSRTIFETLILTQQFFQKSKIDWDRIKIATDEQVFSDVEQAVMLMLKKIIPVKPVNYVKPIGMSPKSKSANGSSLKKVSFIIPTAKPSSANKEDGTKSSVRGILNQNH